MHFYTDVLGLRVVRHRSRRMMPGGMVFLRCNGDHSLPGVDRGAPQKPGGDRQDPASTLRVELRHARRGVPARDTLQATGPWIVYGRPPATPPAGIGRVSWIRRPSPSNSTGASTDRYARPPRRPGQKLMAPDGRAGRRRCVIVAAGPDTPWHERGAARAVEAGNGIDA